MEGLQSDSSQDQGALYALEDVQLADDFQPGARTVNGKERRKKRRLRNEPQSNIGLGEGPSGVNVLDYLEARTTEMNMMQKALANKGGGKRTFQTLSRHMRRRAMSHNPKRLPRRLREAAAKEMEAIDPSKRKKKLPSRAQKRKPSSMRLEYQRRQEENRWLETHIWHTKRMKMVNKYGYRLAECCSDKGVRAAHKSLVHGCLLSDISYYCCNEITGEQSAIISSLGPLFHIDTGLTIRAKAYLKGQREGKAVLYKLGAYPYGAIAPVQFLWQAPPPSAADSAPTKAGGRGQKKPTKLWIWCHAAAQDQVLCELSRAIKAYNCVMNQLDSELLPTRELSAEPGGKTTPPLSVARRNLVRFRLVGPRSHAVLMETLKPVWVSSDSNSDSGCSGSVSESESDKDGWPGGVSYPAVPKAGSEEKGESAEKWWVGGDMRVHLDLHEEALAKDYPAIRSAAGPAHFSRGAVIGMCVQDPRLFTPSERTDMVSSHYPKKHGTLDELCGNLTEEECGNLDTMSSPLVSSEDPSCSPDPLSPLPASLPPEVSYSPVWDTLVCDVVTESKLPDNELNRRRSERFVKSAVLNMGREAPQIPVMLIQQSPQSGASNDLGCGWDLIVPPNWSMAFWVALVYRGARASGVKELEKCSLESQLLHFPQDFPDTATGKQYNSEQRKQLEAHYLKRPPAKRVNYGKLLVPTPFHVRWEDLVYSWSKKVTSDLFTGGDGISEEEEEEASPPLAKRARLEGGDKASKFGVSRTSPCSTASSLSAYHGNHGEIYVLRAKQDLNSLRLFITSVLAGLKRSAGAVVSADTAVCGIFSASVQNFTIDSLLEEHVNSLVPVRVNILHSGTLHGLDCLSLPSPADLQSVASADLSEPFSGPVEEVNKHGMTVLWREELVVGSTPLSRLDVRAVRRKKGTPKGLLPLKDFRLHPVKPSRLTIGRLTSAGYCQTSSVHSGVGFVTLPGLVEAVKACSSAGVPDLLVLARGARTKYFFVQVHVL